MAAPQSSAKLMQSGGGLSRTGHKPVLCKAFKNAVKNWCRDRPNNLKGNFNDYYFRSLSNIRPQGAALAQNISREVGGIFSASSRRFLGLVTDPNLTGYARKAAGCALGIFGNKLGGIPTGMATGLSPSPSDVQGTAARVIKARFGNDVSTRWADGVFRSDGRCLEIKGPTDGPRPGQFRDQKKMGRGKQPAIVSCKSCKANCSKAKPCR
jgi:hypothetical protein